MYFPPDCKTSCENGGQLDDETCQCVCKPNWSGNNCSSKSNNIQIFTATSGTVKLASRGDPWSDPGPISWHCLPQNSARTEPCKEHESMGRKRKIPR